MLVQYGAHLVELVADFAAHFFTLLFSTNGFADVFNGWFLTDDFMNDWPRMIVILLSNPVKNYGSKPENPDTAQYLLIPK